MSRFLAILVLTGFASFGAFAQAPSPSASQTSAAPQSPTPDATKAAVATVAPTAAPKTVDVILLNGEAFPPYPRENADVLLSAAQYQLLVSRARQSESSWNWYWLDWLLPLLVLLAGYLVYARIQTRSGAKALEHMSAKPEVVALHGDVKVMLERQNQLQQLVEAKARP